jgi:hypothetical protein
LWGVLGRGQAGVEKVKEEVDVRRWIGSKNIICTYGNRIMKPMWNLKKEEKREVRIRNRDGDMIEAHFIDVWKYQNFWNPFVQLIYANK